MESLVRAGHMLVERPWRFFFPLGVAGMFAGIGVWLVDAGQALVFHAEFMTALFLLPVISGFLLYMLPRFFSTRRASPWEASLLFLFESAMLLVGSLGWSGPFVVLRLLAMCVLCAFVFLRFPWRVRVGRGNRPIFTGFVGLSVLLGLSGALASAAAEWLELGRPDFARELRIYHKSAFQSGFFWVLFAGMGIRMIPLLTLSTRPPGVPAWSRSLGYSPLFWTVVAVLLAATYVLEPGPLRSPALWARALLMPLIAWQGWLLFYRSARKGVFPRALKLCMYTVLVGHALVAAYPHEAKHWAHLVFGAGLGIGTLMIMSRMALAHEKADLRRELDSRWMLVGIVLLYVAVWTRATSYLLKSYQAHLYWAALLWVLGGLLWLGALLVYLRRGASHSAESG